MEKGTNLTAKSHEVLVSRLYDRRASKYEDSLKTLFFRVYDHQTWECLKATLPRRRITILDAAGGTGRWTRKIASLGHSVVLCDLSREMITEARKLARRDNSKRKISFIRVSVECLPFRTSVFPFVICEHAFFTFAETERPLKELLRVLRNRGRFFFSIQSIWGKTLQQLKVIGGAPGSLWRVGGLRERMERRENFIDPEHFSRLITLLGGRIERMGGKGCIAISCPESVLNSRKHNPNLIRHLISIESILSHRPEFAILAPHTQIIGVKLR